jgi:hypothetical protein
MACRADSVSGLQDATPANAFRKNSEYRGAIRLQSNRLVTALRA